MNWVASILIRLFLAASERLFLKWYNSAKERQVTDAHARIDRMSDSAVGSELRDRWTRD